MRRRCLDNVGTRSATLTRPPRIRSEAAVAVAAARARIGGAGRAGACSCSAWSSSTRATTRAVAAPAALGRLALSIRSPTTASPAGSSGRWLLFLALAALAAARLDASQQRVLAAIMVRVGFLFTAIARAGPVRHHRQAADRPRAAAGRRASRSVSVSSVRLARRLCQSAVRPRRRPPSRAGRASARCGRARAPICLIYALLIAVSRVVVDRALSDRCRRRRAGRHRRRADGAPLVRDAAARLFASAGRRDASYPGPSLRGSKRLPAGCWPTKKHATAGGRRNLT